MGLKPPMKLVDFIIHAPKGVAVSPDLWVGEYKKIPQKMLGLQPLTMKAVNLSNINNLFD